MQLSALQTSAAARRSLKQLFACCLLLTGFALPLSAWAVDADGDGVDDSVDAFPTLPEAITDTDGDGQPDVLNNIIFQDSFNGTVAAGWTGVTTASYDGWRLNSLTENVYSGSGSLVGVGGRSTTVSVSRSVLIPVQGATISYWSKNNKAQAYFGNAFNNISQSLFQYYYWTKSVYPLNAGTQILTWTAGCSYTHMELPSNCGWLDDVEIRFNSSLVEDLDDDNDGVLDGSDQCPLDPACSTDTDSDGIDNALDTDDDNDGLLDLNDNCSLIASADQTNTDGDAQGNVCDTDDDNDGVADTSDKFPLNAAASSDTDNDGFVGSWNAACDVVCQNNSGLVLDNCPVNSNADQLDTDGDTQGDACDTDDDNDGVLDATDQCRLDPTCTTDTDGDGIDNAVDTDDDGDGLLDVNDNCPVATNANQLNADGDTQGNMCDTDDDNDGVVDNSDKFPLNAAASSDTDNDGFAGSWNAACDAVCQSNSGLVLDNCPTSSNSNQLNTDGDVQGNVCDTDDDNDGVYDWADQCPLDPTCAIDTDSDGDDNFVDTDDDNDGALDVNDNCPLFVSADQTNSDGDAQGNVCDTDDDNDGLLDVNDNCPVDSNADQLNIDGDTQGNVCDADDDNDGDLDSDEIAQGSDPLDNNSNAGLPTIISFESGLPVGWTKPAAANVGWVSDATQASHLSKSLRTATTGNSQKAQVQMTAYFSGTSFSFDVKVSTESGNDNFRVYVDGTGQVVKSGELGWQTITVPITAGTHTIKFEYLKNSSIASGSDAVWIDKFSFSNGDVDNDGQTNAADLDDDNDGALDYLDPEPFNAANSSVWPLNNNYQGSGMRESQVVQ